MNVRIVVADERQANFFDAVKPSAPLTERGSLQNPKAGLTDKDLETDRPGGRAGGTAAMTRGAEVSKDILHQGPDVILKAVPPEAFESWRLQ